VHDTNSRLPQKGEGFGFVNSKLLRPGASKSRSITATLKPLPANKRDTTAKAVDLPTPPLYEEIKQAAAAKLDFLFQEKKPSVKEDFKKKTYIPATKTCTFGGCFYILFCGSSMVVVNHVL